MFGICHSLVAEMFTLIPAKSHTNALVKIQYLIATAAGYFHIHWQTHTDNKIDNYYTVIIESDCILFAFAKTVSNLCIINFQLWPFFFLNSVTVWSTHIQFIFINVRFLVGQYRQSQLLIHCILLSLTASTRVKNLCIWPLYVQHTARTDLTQLPIQNR